ncbi:MAG: hypothetical protein H0X37_20955 [Herpetosiphonaceae bacterium]|nr:hypothetical protein [Herpetosiphonaceae bacterium]
MPTMKAAKPVRDAGHDEMRGDSPMHGNQRTSLPGGALAAYAAAVLFIVSLARFFFIPRLGLPASSPIVAELNGGLLPVAAHLLLFPVIAALPAPPWARAAGYGWLVIDIVTDVMALNGVADTIYLPMRYGGHVSAALWIAVASWQASGMLRIVGLLLALDLGGYSFIPHGPIAFLIPSGPLLPLWFALVGRHISRRRRPAGGQPEAFDQ